MQAPPPPPGWPDMSAPPPPPPGWPDMSGMPSAPPPPLVEAPVEAQATEPIVEAVVESDPPAVAAAPAAEGFDYSDDAGKGFENQDVPAPEAKA